MGDTHWGDGSCQVVRKAACAALWSRERPTDSAPYRRDIAIRLHFGDLQINVGSGHRRRIRDNPREDIFLGGPDHCGIAGDGRSARIGPNRHPLGPWDPLSLLGPSVGTAEVCRCTAAIRPSPATTAVWRPSPSPHRPVATERGNCSRPEAGLRFRSAKPTQSASTGRNPGT